MQRLAVHIIRDCGRKPLWGQLGKGIGVGTLFKAAALQRKGSHHQPPARFRVSTSAEQSVVQTLPLRDPSAETISTVRRVCILRVWWSIGNSGKTTHFRP